MTPLPFCLPHLNTPAQNLQLSFPPCPSSVHTGLLCASEPLLVLFLCLEYLSFSPLSPHWMLPHCLRFLLDIIPSRKAFSDPKSIRYLPCTPAPILTGNCGSIIHQSLLGFLCDLIFHPKCKNKGTRFIF